MPQLLLLRHAKSSWDDPKLPDHSRPLNARGKHAAHHLGRILREIGVTPDLVLVSSARRTLQTLEQLEPWQSPPRIAVQDNLYLAPARVMLDLINEVPSETNCLLVVGHNPGLQELALLLAAGLDGIEQQKLSEGFPTTALAWFEFSGSWDKLREGGASLLRFILPAHSVEHGL